MICKNDVEFTIENGWDYKTVIIKCGNTNPYGKRAICNTCEDNPKIMESIQNYQNNVDSDNQWLRSASWSEY